MKTLYQADFIDAAAQIGCSVAAIKAVCQVESPKGGFNPDGTLTTLFESHHFSRLTRGKYDASHPLISSRTWNKKLYGRTWQEERQRLATAGTLDSVAAIMSTSWGRFQIMGFNHGACGFRDAADMVNDFATGERAQLMGFVRLIQAWELDDELRTLNLPESRLRFALTYNGPKAEQNGYPAKINAAYLMHGGV
jgi:N-acetylmuramidase